MCGEGSQTFPEMMHFTVLDKDAIRGVQRFCCNIFGFIKFVGGLWTEAILLINCAHWQIKHAIQNSKKTFFYRLNKAKHCEQIHFD